MLKNVLECLFLKENNTFTQVMFIFSTCMLLYIM